MNDERSAERNEIIDLCKKPITPESTAQIMGYIKEAQRACFYPPYYVPLTYLFPPRAWTTT